MNDEQSQEPREPGQPSQEELRQQIEEQLRKVRVQDLLLESVVSVINLSARRIAKDDERDLEQARVGIEAVRAIVDLLDDDAAKQVRSALSEIQVLYARHAGGDAGEPKEGGEAPQPGGEAPPREGAQGGGGGGLVVGGGGAAGGRGAPATRGCAARALQALDTARKHASPLDSARFRAGSSPTRPAARKPPRTQT